jgi:hypothetical protein
MTTPVFCDIEQMHYRARAIAPQSWRPLGIADLVAAIATATGAPLARLSCAAYGCWSVHPANHYAAVLAALGWECRESAVRHDAFAPCAPLVADLDRLGDPSAAVPLVVIGTAGDSLVPVLERLRQRGWQVAVATVAAASPRLEAVASRVIAWA